MLVRTILIMMLLNIGLGTNAIGKVYWLPDYMMGELQKKGAQDRTKQLPKSDDNSNFKRTNDFGCGAYNATDQDDVGTQDCDSRFRLSNGRWCYLGCCQPCAMGESIYYTDSTSLVSTYSGLSKSIYTPCFDECDGKTFYFPDTSTCSPGNAKSCTDQTYCTYTLDTPDLNGCGTCVGNKCKNGAATVVGECEPYDGNGYNTLSESEKSTCASLTCKKCIANACPSLYAVKTDFCPSATNGSFSLGSAHGTYTQCKKCEIQCTNTCYEKESDTSCKPKNCLAGYATSATKCPTDNPENSEYKIGTSKSGCSGTSDCYKCELQCKSPYVKSCSNQTYCTYTLSSKDSNNCGTCVGNTCQNGAATTVSGCGSYSGNGYYTLSSSAQSTCGSLTCKKCVANACPSGYAVNVAYCGSSSKGVYSLGSAHSTYTQCKKCDFICNSCDKSCPLNATCTYDPTCGCRTGFTCDRGYEKSGSSCVASCSCSMTSCPNNATCSYSSDGCNCVTSFTCDSCYSKNGNSCVEKTCSTTTCPENRSCTTDSCGCVTVGGCKSGYKMCGSNCVQYCYYISSSYWDSCPSGATCGMDQSSCCYYMTGCQPGYHECYGRCDEDGTSTCY